MVLPSMFGDQSMETPYFSIFPHDFPPIFHRLQSFHLVAKLKDLRTQLSFAVDGASENHGMMEMIYELRFMILILIWWYLVNLINDLWFSEMIYDVPDIDEMHCKWLND